MDKKNYEECNHEWKFQIDASESGAPGMKPWASFFNCEKCHNVITLLEKNALDQTIAQQKSLTIQESNTRNGMWANIIAAGLMVIAIVALLFGQGILSC